MSETTFTTDTATIDSAYDPEASIAPESVTDSGTAVAVATLDTPVDVYGEPVVAAVPSRRVNAQGVVHTTGRRKQAIVRARLMPGSGQWTLNGRTLEQYFPNKVHQQLVNEPFTALERVDTFDVIARLHGGGVSGQAGALRLAIARALVELSAEDRSPLKRAGFLTRDPRVKERKKYGLKKARKAPQYSKR